MQLNPKYIVDQDNNKIAVQLDIETFNKLEDLIENYALYQYIIEDNDEEPLKFEEAKSYYNKLKK